MDSLGIRQDEWNDTHEVYRVTFFNDSIETTVTHDPTILSNWISKIEYIHRYRLHKLIVGLDVEWRPSFSRIQNPVATLQLCVGHFCIIFQLLYAQSIPLTLYHFLTNYNYTFVGVRINADVAKLNNNYGLYVGSTVELTHLAVQRWGRTDVKRMGLAKLASEAMQVDFSGKPRWVSTGDWDAAYLSQEQIMYASIDAFLSFETGRLLAAHLGF